MIRVENVSKRYGSNLAVDSASFEVQPGEIAGFLGPNGAGKSTLLKMMSTWLPPTAGRIEIDGFDVERAPLSVRRSLGYLPEHNALYETMRVDRFLRFVGRIRGLTKSQLEQRIGWVVDRCALQEVWSKLVSQCSKGYRQRIGVAAALLHDPRVVLLDEPTHGLDPLQVVAFLDFVRELAGDRSVLFSSHILSEVVAVADRLLVINHGRLLVNAPVSEVRADAEANKRDLESHILDLVRSAEPVSAKAKEAEVPV